MFESSPGNDVIFQIDGSDHYIWAFAIDNEVANTANVSDLSDFTNKWANQCSTKGTFSNEISKVGKRLYEMDVWDRKRQVKVTFALFRSLSHEHVSSNLL
jgi:hypothetical protein